jgi:hypothetical protein
MSAFKAALRGDYTMRRGLFVISMIVGLCVAVPALAQDVDVRLGHRDHDRGFGRVHGESRTVIIRRDHDRDRGWHHRGWDHDRGVHRKVIIDR